MSAGLSADQPSVSATESLELLRDGAILVDVREQNEWDAGHATEAIHVPLAAIAAQAEALRSHDLVVVICRSGRRSAAAVDQLRSVGIEAINLSGGMLAWQEAAQGVVRDDGTPGEVI